MSPWGPARACARCRGTHAHGVTCPVTAARDRARTTAKDAFFNSTAWKRLRGQKLHNSPWCECEDCTARHDRVTATDVDHVISRERRPDLALVYSNLRSMAHGHHSRKTVLEDGGFGR